METSVQVPPMDTVSILLGVAIVLVIALSLGHRIYKGMGIGWQFIRYTVITLGILVAGLLAFNEVLTSPAAAIIAGAMGYVFGKIREE